VPEVFQHVRANQTLKLKPGLSSFALSEDLGGAKSSIEQLLQFANKFVAPNRRSITPVLVKATAGLRAVPLEKANAVLDRVREVLAASEYQSSSAWVSIIPGKEEGGLAWVSANYLSGTFRRSSSVSSSLGVIELGGGSAQVTFEVAEDQKSLAGEDSYLFTTLQGTQFRVYAHSYLGYGQDHAQERMKAAMSKAKVDPCYPRGSWQTSLSEPIIGAGDSQECIANIWEHIFSSSHDAPGRYPSEPRLKGSFVATENFYYIRNDLNLPLLGQPKKMEEAAQSVCQRNFTGDFDELPKHCFALAYQAALIQALQRKTPHGSLFEQNPNIASEDVSLEIVRLINGGEVDWAVGAAVVHIIQASRLEHDGFTFWGRSADWSDSAHGLPHASGLIVAAIGLALGLLLFVRWARRFRGKDA